MQTVPVVVVFGPTAVGKTDFLLHFEHIGEIINSDSLQVYKYMSIGTAKPDASVTSRIPHHLVDCIDPDDEFSAGDFVKRSDKLCHEIYERGRLPMIAGGTGFFLKNFIYGLPDAPASSEEIRQKLKMRLETEGLEALREELKQKDPESWERIKPLDSYRILRALEVYYTSGSPLSDYKLPAEPRSGYRFLLIGLNRDRAELYERINQRVEAMFNAGLLPLLSTLMTSSDLVSHALVIEFIVDSVCLSISSFTFCPACPTVVATCLLMVTGRADNIFLSSSERLTFISLLPSKRLTSPFRLLIIFSLCSC